MKKRKAFRTELTVMMVLACICSVLILGVAQIVLSIQNFSRQAYSDLEFYLENINNQFHIKMQYLEEMVISFRHNSAIKHFLKGMEENDYYNKEEAQEQLKSCANLFSEGNIIDAIYPFVDSAYLFNQKGEWISSRYYPGTVEDEVIGSLKYVEINRIFQESGEEFLYQVQEENIYLCTWIYDENMQTMGSCVVSIGKAAVDCLFGRLKEYPGHMWIVAGNQKQLLFFNEAGNSQSEQLLKIMGELSGEILIGGKNQVFHIVKSGFGIESRVAVRKDVIYDSIQSMLQPFCLVLLLVLGIAGTTVFTLSMRLTKPLQEMGEDIKRFGKEKFDVRMREFDTREFHEISLLFNEMAEQLQKLITQVYEKQILAAKSQMKYLQSQINPHFMFNILTMIGMKAGLKGNVEIQKLLSAFARLIQGKIFREGEILIPLSEEIELIEFYLFLQSERYAGKISYEISCSQELKEYKIPRLTVEPLVENAVSHGLEPKPDKGSISIQVWESEEKLWIQVEDNGVGFDVANMEHIDTDSKHTHIGLTNTRQMLHVVYGDKAGIQVESQLGKGTKALIFIPLENGRSHNVESNDC